MKQSFKVLVLLFAIAIPLQAETISLRDGTVINGTVISQDTTTLKVNSSFGLLSIDRFNILNINYANGLINDQKTAQVEKIPVKDSPKRPLIKWAIGVGAPYAYFGHQFVLVLNDTLEVFGAFSTIAGYNYSYDNSKMFSNYNILSYGLRYYYDTPSDIWLPGTGAYVSLALMSYQYNYEYVWLPGSDSSHIKYDDEFTLAMLGLGVDGKVGLLHANIELGYGVVVANKFTDYVGNSSSDPSNRGGLILAGGIGIAL